MRYPLLLIGKRFHNLVVTEYLGYLPQLNSGRKDTYKCLCDCGKYTTVLGSSLLSHNTKSCGCRRGANRGGLSHMKIYKSWRHAKDRCFNPDNARYSKYGGRGITMCAYLKEGPQNLLKLIGHRKSIRDSLHRTNNDGHYSCGQCEECLKNKWPLNVEWASPEKQQDKSPPKVSINGIIKSCYDWAMEYKQKLEREPKLESYDELFLTTY